jgi:uncharacterized protein YyaL (SSP411 family)
MQEKSAYLRHAAKQKINWYPWSEEAFEKARNEDKPVFLSSGAIWCHWCHVMAKESFEDDEVAMLLNDRYVAVKLDRDERPDVDRRYQQAVTVMGVNGGWPLNVFLTPDKVPFYGGTYFPVADSFGKPGFKTLLKALSDFYTTRKEEVYENSRKFHDFLKQQSPRKGKASEVLVNEAVKNIMKAFDKAHGGFGTSPKFPMSGAIEFLLNRYFFTKDRTIEEALRKTLIAMASGGFHDQLGGGFHRYSTDEAWVVPHFEKMTEDNAWLLRNYTDAYSLLGDEFFKKVAENIIYFTRSELSRPDGGFYASMDADVTPDDEGGYFTWTDEELRKILTSDEYSVFSLYFIHERNAMYHDRNKFVLSVSMGVDDIGRRLNIAAGTVKDKLVTARQKLLTERNKRQKPFVDSALYTSLNGMMIASYLKAYMAFNDEKLKEFALNSLERILQINVENGKLLHSQGVKALLDDYIYIIDALISAYDISANTEYLTLAEGFMTDCLAHFWDPKGGGFFDTDEEVIGLRLKNIEDIPRPAANALAITVLLKLALILNKEEYRQYADTLLNTFSTDAQLLQVHGAYFFCGLDAFYHMLKLDIKAPYDSALAGVALHTYRPYRCLVYSEPDKNSVIPCIGNTCYEPINDSGSLRDYIRSMFFRGADESK